jgi:hypothetical protein
VQKQQRDLQAELKRCKIWVPGRMASIKEIEFVIPETNGPLARVSGALAQHILQKSDLVQNLLEDDKNDKNAKTRKTLIIPIGDFPTDRKSLFLKILKGVPVGVRESDEGVYLYPLGREEERDISAAVNAKNLSKADRDYAIQEERLKAIMDTMRYLLMSDDDILAILKFDELKNKNTRATEDDEIESLVDDHKRWLFLTRQAKKLTQQERNALQAEFEELKERVYSNFNYNHPDEDKLKANSYEPIDVETTGDMWPIEYERWLRTEYFKPQRARLNLPPRLNTLFKNTGNSRRAARKSRKARKNRRQNTRRQRK